MRVLQTILLLALSCSAAMAQVEIKSMDFKSTKENGQLTIKFDGVLKEYPELRVSNSLIQVVIPDSKLKREINKKVAFSSKTKDTSVNVAAVSNNSSRVKALFPFSMSKYRDKVSLMIKDNTIELNFPRVKVKPVAVKKVAAVKAKAKAKSPKKDYLNEDYLNSLLKIEKKKEKVVAGKIIRPKMENDEVKTTLAATQKATATNSKSSFSLVEYGGKIVAFLAVTILLFYGIVSLMKKGFIKKGKLGFLNKTDQVQVLSQTYIAPKKSLMMIKAHNQVFLVSNTDAGI
ncbi:MAG: FliO/MopB family protein, partial [Bacteriovoracaceae bacterium]|nr:FliO/MopB family protein [Bacteriovoracaceae bacterium]